MSLSFVRCFHKVQALTDVNSWFIKQGEEIIVDEGRRRQYGITLKEGEIVTPRHAQIVMSSLPADRLPVLSIHKGCRPIVSVTYKLTKNDMTLESGQRWKLKKRFWKADFFFVTKLGPADLRFEILGRNGTLSSPHESLQVEFTDESNERTPHENGVAAMPRTTMSGRYA